MLICFQAEQIYQRINYYAAIILCMCILVYFVSFAAQAFNQRYFSLHRLFITFMLINTLSFCIAVTSSFSEA